MDISDKIVRLRKKNKMTQEKLAMRLGVGTDTVDKWEKGLLKPDDVQRRRLGNVFKTDPDYFRDRRPSLFKVITIHLDRITKRHRNAVLATAAVSLLLAFAFMLLAADHLMTFFSVLAILSVTVSILAFVFYGRNKKR